MTLAQSSDPSDDSSGTASHRSSAAGATTSHASQHAGLRTQVDASWNRYPAEKLFGPAGGDGSVYLWGLASATGSTVADDWRRLASWTGCASAEQVQSLLPDGGGTGHQANGRPHSGKGRRQGPASLGRLAKEPSDGNAFSAWAIETATRWLEETPPAVDDTPAALTSVIWASAMPMLMRLLPPGLWWDLLGELQQRRELWWDDTDSTAACRLIGVGELGMTLAWRLKRLPSCHRLVKPSLEAVREFFDGGEETIGDVLRQPTHLRLVVASTLRLENLIPRVSKRKLKKGDLALAFNLAGWTAAMTRHDGTAVFSDSNPADIWPDLRDQPTGQDKRLPKPPTKNVGKQKDKKKGGRERKTTAPNLPAGGLLGAMTRLDQEALSPAVAASLGQSHSGGRLAWEVSLPESMWHDDEAGVAALLPEWDVRRGRTFVDYHGQDVFLEIMGGRRPILQGTVQTMIDVDGQSQQPTGPWQSICEYTDDDVHYLEIEQAYSGGVVLQRQLMLVRDDRCVMLSDAVVPGHRFASFDQADLPPVRCLTRIPIAPGLSVETDEETRDIYLGDKKRRALAVPLAASEWRVGMTNSRLEVSEDQHLVLTTTGRGAVYSPLWLDFQPRRFRRKRTWRQLTVADQLQILPRNVASAFRMQIGSEHWIVYRGLTSTAQSTGLTPRSFLGKHLVADFFAARFHPGDGGMEELVTVDREFD